MPTGPRPLTGRLQVVGPVVACVLLGVLTGLLGTAVHLARAPVLGVLVPYGVLLAVALVVATDVAVAAAALARRRPGPGVSLLAVAAGRGLLLGLVLLPTDEGDLVITGLPASTVWVLLSVLLPSFAAPMAVALAATAGNRPAAARPGAPRPPGLAVGP